MNAHKYVANIREKFANVCNALCSCTECIPVHNLRFAKMQASFQQKLGLIAN